MKLQLENLALRASRKGISAPGRNWRSGPLRVAGTYWLE
jgi:hypothetical protein